MEKAVLVRLRKEVGALCVTPDEHPGFRAAHLTVHRLVRVVKYITTGFNWKQYTGALFLFLKQLGVSVYK